MRGGLGIGGGVTSSPHQSHHMVTTYAAKVPKSPLNTQFQSLGGLAVGAGCVLALIAIELDRERCRNIHGEIETEFVRNSKVLDDFEVRT